MAEMREPFAEFPARLRKNLALLLALQHEDGKAPFEDSARLAVLMALVTIIRSEHFVEKVYKKNEAQNEQDYVALQKAVTPLAGKNIEWLRHASAHFDIEPDNDAGQIRGFKLLHRGKEANIKVGDLDETIRVLGEYIEGCVARLKQP